MKCLKNFTLIKIFLLSFLIASPLYSVGEDKHGLLKKAVDRGDNLVHIRNLVKDGANIHLKDKTNGSTLLHLASQKGYIDIIEFLIEMGVDIDAQTKQGETPLHWVIKWPKGTSNLFNVSKVLIDRGADISIKDNQGMTALHHAINSKEIDIAKLLIETYSDDGMMNYTIINAISNNGKTPSHLAIEKDSIEIAEILIAHLANIEARDDRKKTPLHYAKSLDMTKLLVEHGADINATDKDGNTILYYAILHYKLKIITYLIEIGVNINIKNWLGETVLHLTSRRGDWEIVLALIKDAKRKAQLNIKNNEGMTALHWAVKEEKEKVVELLLENGADPTIKNNEGETSIDLAKPDTNIMELLLSKVNQ